MVFGMVWGFLFVFPCSFVLVATLKKSLKF